MPHLFFSYLDPGTGSMVIQTVIGAVAGAAFLGRNTISRVVNAIRSKKPTTDE